MLLTSEWEIYYYFVSVFVGDIWAWERSNFENELRLL